MAEQLPYVEDSIRDWCQGCWTFHIGPKHYRWTWPSARPILGPLGLEEEAAMKCFFETDATGKVTRVICASFDPPPPQSKPPPPKPKEG